MSQIPVTLTASRRMEFIRFRLSAERVHLLENNCIKQRILGRCREYEKSKVNSEVSKVY